MLSLTRQERIVLLSLVLVLLCGASLRAFFKGNPGIYRQLNFLEDTRLYPRVDVNTVSYEELLNLPLIGPALAERIIAYRSQNGSFRQIAQLKEIQGIGERNYSQISSYLTVR